MIFFFFFRNCDSTATHHAFYIKHCVNFLFTIFFEILLSCFVVHSLWHVLVFYLTVTPKEYFIIHVIHGIFLSKLFFNFSLCHHATFLPIFQWCQVFFSLFKCPQNYRRSLSYFFYMNAHFVMSLRLYLQLAFSCSFILLSHIQHQSWIKEAYKGN